MLPLPVTVLVVAGVVAIPALMPQNLGELAARERERRKGLTARLYTDEDLLQARMQRENDTSTLALVLAPPPESPAVPAEASVPAAPKAAKTEDELREEQEKEWRGRLEKAREEVLRLSESVDRLQLGLNDLSQNLYGVGRRAQIERLEEAKGQLVVARQSVEGLEEEGRRSRFRP
jgi:hypothetical protein